MAKEKTSSESKHSAELLLAEHSRISGLYEANAQMGDKYVTMYLTIMSLAIALLLGISKFSTLSTENISIDLALMIVVFIIGFTIFRRLIDRRIRMIEYLRAINRINHYFAARDKEVEKHLFWNANDDEPPIHAKGTFLGGLRNIVIVLNSLTVGILAYLAVQLFAPLANLFIFVSISIACTLITFFGLKQYGGILIDRRGKTHGKNHPVSENCIG